MDFPAAPIALEIWAFLANRPDAKVIVASHRNSFFCEGVWKAMSEIYTGSSFLQQYFKPGERRFCYKPRPETWWASLRNWTDDNRSEALAGLMGDALMYVVEGPADLPLEIERPIRASLDCAKYQKFITVEQM